MKLKEWAAFALLGLVWGSSFLWIKIALQEIGPFTLVAFRLLFGLAGLFAIMILRRLPFPRDRKILSACLFLGLVNTAVPFVLISWGETRIASGLASILNGTLPLFTIVIAHVWLHDEKITLPRIAGLLVGFAGVVVLVSRDLGPGSLSGSVWGQVAIVAASASYATGITFLRRYLRGHHPVVLSTLQLIVADALVWLSFPAAGLARQFTPLAEPRFTLPVLPLTWIALLWLGLLGSCLAYTLYFFLINSWGPTRASVVSYIFPVIGLILGIVILREAVDWRLLAGSALIVAGIAVVNLRFGRRPQTAPAAGSAD